MLRAPTRPPPRADMTLSSTNMSSRRNPLTARFVFHTSILADMPCTLHVDLCSRWALMAMAERFPSHFISRPVQRPAAVAATPAGAEEEAAVKEDRLGRDAGAATGGRMDTGVGLGARVTRTSLTTVPSMPHTIMTVRFRFSPVAPWVTRCEVVRAGTRGRKVGTPWGTMGGRAVAGGEPMRPKIVAVTEGDAEYARQESVKCAPGAATHCLEVRVAIGVVIVVIGNGVSGDFIRQFEGSRGGHAGG